MFCFAHFVACARVCIRIRLQNWLLYVLLGIFLYLVPYVIVLELWISLAHNVRCDLESDSHWTKLLYVKQAFGVLPYFQREQYMNLICDDFGHSLILTSSHFPLTLRHKHIFSQKRKRNAERRLHARWFFLSLRNWVLVAYLQHCPSNNCTSTYHCCLAGNLHHCVS